MSLMQRLVSLLALSLAFAVAPSLTAQEEAPKPNIIFILADDLGYGDLGCFGQVTLQTPNIDQMAAEGMRLMRHYAGSTVCAPSRCVLMTGLHTGHCTVRGNGAGTLKDDEVTVAHVLKDAGYATGCVGKWGIGNPPPPNDPERMGFDYFYGYVNMFHAHNFFPEFLIKNGEKVKLGNVLEEKWRNSEAAKEGRGVAAQKVDYAPDLIHQEALDFIDRSKGGPFFLYYALNIPHANNEGGKNPDGVDGMEVQDLGEFAEKDWPNAEKGFAAMIRNIDDYVGDVMAKLNELGIAEDTLLIFSSDNGPHQEGGHQVDFFDSNGELWGMKRDLYEGGIRVPTIAWWPGTIKEATFSGHISAFQDFLPTCAELAGAELPERCDGISFVPTLMGKANEQKQHPYLYWEFLERGGKKAVLAENWKLILQNTRVLADPLPELYDLLGDDTEDEPLEETHPDKVAELMKLMEEAHVPPLKAEEN